jgi:hypothetical protein
MQGLLRRSQCAIFSSLVPDDRDNKVRQNVRSQPLLVLEDAWHAVVHIYIHFSLQSKGPLNLPVLPHFIHIHGTVLIQPLVFQANPTTYGVCMLYYLFL